MNFGWPGVMGNEAINPRFARVTGWISVTPGSATTSAAGAASKILAWLIFVSTTTWRWLNASSASNLAPVTFSMAKGLTPRVTGWVGREVNSGFQCGLTDQFISK